MNLERARVVAVIRAVRDAVLEDRASGMVRQQDPWGCEILRRACAEQGVAVDQWVAALRAEAELARLFEQAMDELVTELPDPGPYDVPSRRLREGCGAVSMTDGAEMIERARRLGPSRRLPATG
jgi:hypothetical protein